MLRMGRMISALVDAMTVIAGLAIAFMMIHITADVVSRAAFNRPLPGTITIVSNFYMVMAAFIPLALAEKKSAHISVELVTETMPPALQRHLAALMLVLSGAVFALLTVRTLGEALTKYQIGASLMQGVYRIPVWPSYFVLPLGCGLMCLVVAVKLVAYAAGRTDPFPQPDVPARTDGER